jgi:hypothetical protein
MPPRVLPDGLAKLVPAGSKLMFQVHCTPHGTPRADRSEIGLVFADPKTIRKDEFEWQNVYLLSKPRVMLEGSALRYLARYDNSAGNFSNPEPTKTVRWGEQTKDEMVFGYVKVARADQDRTFGSPAIRIAGRLPLVRTRAGRGSPDPAQILTDRSPSLGVRSQYSGGQPRPAERLSNSAPALASAAQPA